MSKEGINKLAAAIAPKVALLELAECCERAAGPDGELDAEIDRAVRAEAHTTTPPGYTRSLDWAMTLVPTGWPVRDLSQWRAQKSALDDSVSDEHWTVALDWPGRKYCQVDGMGATAPLTLCAAALRALAAGARSDETLQAAQSEGRQSGAQGTRP